MDIRNYCVECDQPKPCFCEETDDEEQEGWEEDICVPCGMKYKDCDVFGSLLKLGRANE